MRRRFAFSNEYGGYGCGTLELVPKRLDPQESEARGSYKSIIRDEFGRNKQKEYVGLLGGRLEHVSLISLYPNAKRSL